MRISAELGALQGDPTPLLSGCGAAAAAARIWREERPWLADELARFGAGAPLATCGALSALFTGAGDAAQALGRALVLPMLAAAREHPLAQLPYRHFSNGTLHSLTVAVAGEASLSLAVIDAAAWRAARDPAAAPAVAFQPGELHARMLAGFASARRVTLVEADSRSARLACEPLPLDAGTAYRLDGSREALVFDAMNDSLVSLRLHRQRRATTPARQYDLATGTLLHQAAADQCDSRIEMIMALLRRMERADAAPVLAELAFDGPPPARWQALRECLALDSGVGVAALARVAGASADPLAGPARQLLDGLAARDPAFARAREELLCPA